MFIRARTRKKPKFIGWSPLGKWWFMLRFFELCAASNGGPSNGPVVHVRAFCANWLFRPTHVSIRGWRQLKRDALS